MMIAALPLFAAACRSPNAAMYMAITPGCAVSASQLVNGAPVAVTYTWTVDPEATGYLRPRRAFVRFVDLDGVVLFTDDHVPTPAILLWERGRTYRYTRTVLIPPLVPLGPVEVRMGLLDGAAERDPLALKGAARGFYEYAVRRIEIVRDGGRHQLSYGQGWYETDAPAGDPFSERRWTAREAWVAFPNRQKDVVVLVKGDTYLKAFPRPQQVEIVVGHSRVRWTITGGPPFFKRFRFPAAALGAGRWAELRIAVDQTFVPKRLGIANDYRELGLWVHYLFIAPADDLDSAFVKGAEAAEPDPVAPHAPANGVNRFGSEIDVAPLSGDTLPNRGNGR